MIGLNIYVITNDKHLWLVPPFIYLFQKYWPNQKINIVGFNFPGEMRLQSKNVDFISIDDQNWADNKWSDALLNLMDYIPDTHFVLMLEDYWINKPVNISAIHSLCEMAQSYDDILRIDLSNDRQYNADHTDAGERDGIHMIETSPNSPYQISLQAGIWNKHLLTKAIQPGWSPWDVEIQGSILQGRLNGIGGRVLGTTINPLPYVPVVRNKKPNHLSGMDLFSSEDRATIRRLTGNVSG